MKKTQVVAVALCLTLASVSLAANPAATASCAVKNKRSGRSWGPDLQQALDESVRGAVLMISGTCTGTFTIHRNVTLRGRPVPGHPSPTLDGDAKGTVLTIAHAADVTLIDLRIQGGKASSGGGIAVGVLGQRAHNSVVRLIDTLVTGNAAKSGGGISAKCCHLVILRGTSAIRGNTACDGGGAFTEGNLWLKDVSVISRNKAGGPRCRRYTRLGGGIYDAGSVKLFDSASVVRNLATRMAGGVLLDGDLGGVLIAQRKWSGRVRHNAPNDCSPSVTLGHLLCD